MIAEVILTYNTNQNSMPLLKRKSIPLIRVFVLVLAVGVCGLSVQAQSINWTSLSDAQKMAVEDNKKVMIFAEAEWCGYCKKMYEEVFPKESVQDSLHKYFHPVRIDIESRSKITFNNKTFTEQELSRKFRATSTPTTIFINAKGEIIGAQPGYLPAEIYDKLMAFVGRDLTGTISFKEYLGKHGVEID